MLPSPTMPLSFKISVNLDNSKDSGIGHETMVLFYKIHIGLSRAKPEGGF